MVPKGGGGAEQQTLKTVAYQEALGVGASSGQVGLQILPEVGAGVLADRFPFACCPIPCVPAQHSTMLDENILLTPCPELARLHKSHSMLPGRHQESCIALLQC